MNRLEKKKRSSRPARTVFPILVFCSAAALFALGLNSVSAGASAEEAENLRASVLRGAVQCYALEGFYPEDLAYLEENYSVSYDHSRYVVSYEPVGSNLMPDVTVIPLDTDHRKAVLP